MVLPAENRGKVGNIVRNQQPQFRELYHRLVVGLPGVHWPLNTNQIQQDISPQARSAHLRKLPSNLLNGVTARFAEFQDLRKEEENAYWVKLSEDQAKLNRVLNQGVYRTLCSRDFTNAPLRDA